MRRLGAAAHGRPTARSCLRHRPPARSIECRQAADSRSRSPRLAPGQNDHRAPVILPDGRHFIFYARGSSDRPRRVCRQYRWLRAAPSPRCGRSRRLRAVWTPALRARGSAAGAAFRSGHAHAERRALQGCRQRQCQSRRQPRHAGRFVGRRHCLCHGRHHAAPVCVVRSIGRGSRPSRNTGFQPGHQSRAVAGRPHARIRAADGRQLGHLADGDGARRDDAIDVGAQSRLRPGLDDATTRTSFTNLSAASNRTSIAARSAPRPSC